MLRAFAIVVSILILVFGLTLLLDFKGFASRHAKWTHSIYGARPRRWPLQLSERAMRNSDRVIGGVFAIAGLLALVASIFGQVTVD